jgi:hypothetical protein
MKTYKLNTMKHLLLKAAILLLLFVALFELVSCSSTQKVTSFTKRSNCPAYRGSYAKYQFHSSIDNHIYTKDGNYSPYSKK